MALPIPPIPPAGATDGANMSDAPPPSQSIYSKAGRTIRHALADQDDEALGQAICDLVKYDSAQEEPDGDEGDDGGEEKKPNLAVILANKGKGK